MHVGDFTWHSVCFSVIGLATQHGHGLHLTLEDIAIIRLLDGLLDGYTKRMVSQNNAVNCFDVFCFRVFGFGSMSQ